MANMDIDRRFWVSIKELDERSSFRCFLRREFPTAAADDSKVDF
jgi:MoCo/4Fe-4S cofactor protein with predicted Tat translocation signal